MEGSSFFVVSIGRLVNSVVLLKGRVFLKVMGFWMGVAFGRAVILRGLWFAWRVESFGQMAMSNNCAGLVIFGAGIKV